MNKFKKVFFVLAMLVTISSCRKKELVTEVKEQVIEVEKKEEKKELGSYRVSPLSFSSKIILANMDENNKSESNDKAKIEIEKLGNYSKIENKDFDIAIVPAFLGPYFYNRTEKGVEVAAITQTGNIHMVSDTQLNSQRDYRNKNFYVPDPAGNLSPIIDSKIGPLNMILRLNIEYYKSMDEITKKMDHTNNYVSILAEPYYTKALRKTHYVSNVSDLLPIRDDEFLTEIIIVNKDYIKDNKEDFDLFLASYNEELKKIDDIDISKDILDEYELTKEEAKLSLDRTDFTFVSGSQMKDDYVKFVDRLAEVDKKIFDGDKPDDGFYYINK